MPSVTGSNSFCKYFYNQDESLLTALSMEIAVISDARKCSESGFCTCE